jgi:hypothetical protein
MTKALVHIGVYLQAMKKTKYGKCPVRAVQYWFLVTVLRQSYCKSGTYRSLLQGIPAVQFATLQEQ